jgi:tight adherence protein C
MTGGLLGLCAGGGAVLAARYSPPMRPIRLADRVSPYVASPAPSRLLDRPPASAVPFATARRVFGPALSDAVAVLDRTVGGNASVRRRLNGLGGEMSVEEFRLEQILAGAAAMVGAAALVLLAGLARGSFDPVVVAAVALAGLVGGVLGRDYWLTHQLARRERFILAEFPVVADLLALAVAAGEAPVEALARVTALTGGELARDIAGVLARARSGRPLVVALGELAERTTLEPLATFVHGVIVAIDRGTPLADVLRAQAVDVREISRRALLDASGKKEISMMLPVVFLILPVTVLFALYPGLLTLTSIAR